MKSFCGVQGRFLQKEPLAAGGRKMKTKPIITIVSLILMFVYSITLSAEDRREVSFMIGTGTAVSCFKGLFVDIGAEIPFAKRFYVQGMLDYYFSPGDTAGSEKPDDSAIGIALYGVLKIPLSERWGLFIKAGPNYTIHNTTETAFGVSYPVRNTYKGIGGGLGLHYLFAHRVYIQVGGTVKARFTQDNSVENYWIKIYGGFRYLIGVKGDR
jgi:hypothetical protein